MAFNVKGYHPPLLCNSNLDDHGESTVTPYPLSWDAPFRYSAKLGHAVVVVPGIGEQAQEGLFSTPVGRRRRARRERGWSAVVVPVEEEEEEEEEDVFIYDGVDGVGEFVPDDDQERLQDQESF